jgi:hypothetical protein
MLELFRQFLRRKPFHPFRVVLRSGERYEIVDPEKVAVGQTKAFALVRGKMAELRESEIELVYEPRFSQR